MGEEKGMVGGGWRDEGEDCNKVNISLLSPTHVHTHTHTLFVHIAVLSSSV